MRYQASEKLEIIRLVERAHLPARRTLETLGILPSTFYRWYDRYQAGGPSRRFCRGFSEGSTNAKETRSCSQNWDR